MEGNCEINTDFNLVGMFPAGLNSEGLYRVSGFSDLIEDVKMAFDRGMFFPCAAILNRHSLSVQPSPASCSAVPAVRGSGGLCRQKGGGGGGLLRQKCISDSLQSLLLNLLSSFHQYLCFSDHLYKKQ